MNNIILTSKEDLTYFIENSIRKVIKEEFALSNSSKNPQKNEIVFLEEATEINANPNDPVDGVVWRLPPSTTDNPDTLAIGESDRMTLRFRKPE